MQPQLLLPSGSKKKQVSQLHAELSRGADFHLLLHVFSSPKSSVSPLLTLQALPGEGVVVVEVDRRFRCLDREGVEVLVVCDLARLRQA